MKWDIGHLLVYLAVAISGASVIRLALDWLNSPLRIWIAPGSKFWTFYDKLERTFAVLSLALAALGRKAEERGFVVQQTTVSKLVVPADDTESPRLTESTERTTRPLEGRS